MPDAFLIYLTGVSIAIGASLLGVFVILRRMALVSDALSHVALPWIAVGLLYGFNPFWGALAALLLAVFLILFIEEKTTLVTETAVGILFTAALAIGTLLTPKEELLESLFGSLSLVTPFNFWLAFLGSAAIAVVIILLFSPLTRASLSQELLRAEGFSTKRYQFIYLLLLAFLLSLGMRIVGALLMGALLILPAATAKNFAKTIKLLTIWSLVIGVSSALIGIWISLSFHLPPGPAIILTNVGFFLFTLFLGVRTR